MANILERIRNIALGVSDAEQNGSMPSAVYLQQIRNAILGVPDGKFGTLDETIYLQQIRNAILGVSDGKFGMLDETVYLQQIRNAILGVPDGKFGNLDAAYYWDEILDAAIKFGLGGTGDTVAPTLVITMSSLALAAGDTPTVTFTFSESPVGFTVSNVTAQNGSLSGFGATGNPLIYTAIFTPDNVTDASNVITVDAGWTDAAGNHPAASTISGNYTIVSTYYVNSTGDDVNDGKSAPWRTVTAVNSQAFLPGERVLFNRGDVFSGVTLLVPSSGNAGGDVIFGAYGSGANPAINKTNDYGINTNGKNYITFQNIDGTAGKQTYHVVDSHHVYIENANCANDVADESSINITSTSDSACHDIYVQDCVIQNTPGWGITAGGTYVVDSLFIQRCTINNIAAGGAVQHHGIYFTNVSNFIIEDCTIYRPAHSGVKLVQSGGKVTSGIVRRNKITEYGYSGASPIGISLDGVSGSLVIACNHIADGNQGGNAMGITVVNHTASNVEVYNNTIVRNYLGINMDLTPTGWIIKNNNIVQDYAWFAHSLRCCIYIADTDIVNNLFQDNNYWFNDGASSRNPIKVDGDAITFSAWQGKAGSPDSTGTSVDPLFVAEYTDLHLQSGSTLRGSASAIAGVETDRDGVALDATPDVGCYQYV